MEKLISDNASMIKNYIKPFINDQKIIQAFFKVPRKLFVPKEYREYAYEDITLPIECGQRISQPSLVALMIKELKLKGNENVLEIGTGSGYQVALLSYLAKKVFSMEIIPELVNTAKRNISNLKIENVFITQGNGVKGLKKFAPFDAIIVAAAGKEIPKQLINQLIEGGRIVIPISSKSGENLILGIKVKNDLEIEDLFPVRFVPLVGK